MRTVIKGHSPEAPKIPLAGMVPNPSDGPAANAAFPPNAGFVAANAVVPAAVLPPAAAPEVVPPRGNLSEAKCVKSKKVKHKDKIEYRNVKNSSYT